VARNGPPRRLDLARVHAVRLHGFEAERAEIELGSALGRAVDPALELLAELGPLRLKHGPLPPALCRVAVAPPALAARLRAFARPPLRRHRIVLKDFALEHPHLDAAGAVRRVRRRLAVIDVRPE